MPTCTKCNSEKPISDFPKDARAKGGIRTLCRVCHRKREDNLKARKRAEYAGVWPRSCGICKISKGEEEYSESVKFLLRPRCKECIRAKNDMYKVKNRDTLAASRREAYFAVPAEIRKEKRAKEYLANREKILQDRREFHLINGERRREYQKAYYRANREATAVYMLNYVKTRYASDPLFALKMNMRGRLNHVIAGNGWVKSRKNEEVFGCSYEFLMKYLESLFEPGMGWHNRSDWHIDHIVPLASASSREEILRLCHYTNLQPLWARDNLSKGAKMPEELTA